MEPASSWLLLAASLSGSKVGAARVRVWRALKDAGVASLRDGVSLAPRSEPMRGRLAEICADIEGAGGSAWLLELQAQAAPVERKLRALFDRAESYTKFLPAVAALRRALPSLDEAAARQRLRELDLGLESIVALDFFPGAAQARARDALDRLRARISQRFSPSEPVSVGGTVAHRRLADYRKQRWATRRRMWVDRVASAWLIRHFIDHEATFLWLARPADCPKGAHGFDFDGAEFTHVGERVTFEVLLHAFGLERDTGLARLGKLVHFLDVGGEAVPEAAGFEAVLAGLRESSADDDALLAAAAPVLDALYDHFSKS
ncbi:MAG TPA: chromate resistance protein ChrB domain-containing protein [Gammaproteobacteria bacterium]|nr:chromate resistance protein ChrB domain-containing protein [Gammaproteobacteria bacterium]